jgi:hypothetical protein
MIGLTAAMQSSIEKLLSTEPMTAQEIAGKAGTTVAMVRFTMGALEHKGKALSSGQRPVRYCAVAKPTKTPDRSDYQAPSAARYYRPGSYTPPRESTHTLPGMGDLTENEESRR